MVSSGEFTITLGKQMKPKHTPKHTNMNSGITPMFVDEVLSFLDQFFIDRGVVIFKLLILITIYLLRRYLIAKFLRYPVTFSFASVYNISWSRFLSKSKFAAHSQSAGRRCP